MTSGTVGTPREERALDGGQTGGNGTVNLRPLDLGCFAFYMLLLVGTGVYFTRKQKKGLQSYLFADQDIHWVIVAISVLAALFSGITYLGRPPRRTTTTWATSG